jgi:hypothetical protein
MATLPDARNRHLRRVAGDAEVEGAIGEVVNGGR